MCRAVPEREGNQEVVLTQGWGGHTPSYATSAKNDPIPPLHQGEVRHSGPSFQVWEGLSEARVCLGQEWTDRRGALTSSHSTKQEEVWTQGTQGNEAQATKPQEESTSMRDAVGGSGRPLGQ